MKTPFFGRPQPAPAAPPAKLRPHIAVTFRWLCGGDLPAVASIEAASFAYPKSFEELDVLRSTQGVVGLVAEYQGYTAGFVFYSFNRGWLELHDLAVHPELRGHGVGRQMMDTLRTKLERGGRHKMTATLRESCLDGLCYLRACGWRAPKKGAVLRGFWGDSGEDAVIMIYRAAEDDCGLLGRGWEA